MSTQELLQTIEKKIENGHTEFEIEACGQHDIGGSSWAKSGKNLIFNITNPGQRVGAMGMDGTKIVVEGSAPADIGWLNSGAEIVVKGDGGDTAAHCAAVLHNVFVRRNYLLGFRRKRRKPNMTQGSAARSCVVKDSHGTTLFIRQRSTGI